MPPGPPRTDVVSAASLFIALVQLDSLLANEIAINFKFGWSVQSQHKYPSRTPGSHRTVTNDWQAPPRIDLHHSTLSELYHFSLQIPWLSGE